MGTTDPMRAFGRAELDSLRRLADLGSVALEQAEMRKHLELAVGSGVEALTEAIDMRDHYTWQHSQNVMELAGKLGKRMELDESALAELAFAARLHDVGKVGVPDSVLLKAGPLNDDEWEIMKQYPLRGAEMLERVPGTRQRRAARAVGARALGRLGLPAGSEGRGDPAHAAASSWCATPTTR